MEKFICLRPLCPVVVTGYAPTFFAENSGSLPYAAVFTGKLELLDCFLIVGLVLEGVIGRLSAYCVGFAVGDIFVALAI